MTLRHMYNTLVPIVFFGYALVLNATLLWRDVDKSPIYALTPIELGQSLDQLYSERQLHRSFAQASFGAMRYLLLREGREGVVVGPQGWLFSSEEMRAQLDPDLSEQVIDTIVGQARALRESGAQVIVLLLPTKVESLGFSQNTGAYLASQKLTRALRAANIVFLDAGPVLKHEDSFFKTDTHWTPQGAENVAQLLAQTFPSMKGQARFTDVPMTPEQFSGDLISFVTTEQVAPMLGLPKETSSAQRSEVMAGNDIDLFAPSPPSIGLVGTSYSANARWGFDDALKRAFSSDVLNFAQVGQGPLAPMKAYLERDDVHEVKTVIWEIPVRYLTDPKLLEDLK